MNKYIKFIIEADKNLILDELYIKDISDSNLEKYVFHIVNFFSDWQAFVDDSIRVEVFNSESKFYSNYVCKSIDKVIEYSLMYNKIEEVQVLSYILYCFHQSYDKCNMYASNRLNDYKKQFYTNFPKKEFYNNGEILKNTVDFINDYIDYIINNYEENTLNYKFYCQLSFLLNILNTNRQNELQLHVNDLIIKFDNYTLMVYLIKFDKNTSKNKYIYLNKELCYFKGIYEKTEFRLIKELYKQKLINECDENIILNYINNKLVPINLKEKYDIEYITNNVIDMCNIIIKLEEVSQRFKNELKQVKLYAEQMARENTINPNKNYFDEIVDINSTNFNEVIQEVTDDIKYEFMKCNFNIELFFLKEFVVQYDSILESIVKGVIDITFPFFETIHYDTDNMLVKKSKDKYTENTIRKYYSDKMSIIYNTKFIKESNRHLYKEEKGYKYLIDENKEINKAVMHIINKVFKECNIKFNVIKDVIASLGIFNEDSLNNIQNNCQIIVMKIIISIESELVTMYNKNFDTKIDNYSEDILFELFNKFSSDNEFKNSITYIYVSLYDNMGLNIRNLYAHGNKVSAKNIWNNILVVITCFRCLTAVCLTKANINSLDFTDSVTIEAEYDNSTLIEEFNKMNAKFGYVPTYLFEKDNINDLYYFFPMIERLFRFILHEQGSFDIENKASQTYRTLFSIIDVNRDRLVKHFDDEILYYLEDTYKEDGVRNKVMHFNKNYHASREVICGAKYIFTRLVGIYVELKK